MIPKTGWKDMESAPRDGSPIMVRYHEWNKQNQPEKVQAAQWLCDEDGKNWTWRAPYRVSQTVHAYGWMHMHEFVTACAVLEAKQEAAEAPAFDL